MDATKRWGMVSQSGKLPSLSPDRSQKANRSNRVRTLGSPEGLITVKNLDTFSCSVKQFSSQPDQKPQAKRILLQKRHARKEKVASPQTNKSVLS